MIIVRRGYNAGQSVNKLAELTKRSRKTIRRWLIATGVLNA